MSNHYDSHGIAYASWQAISGHTGTMTPQECMEAWSELNSGFMTPQVERFQTSPNSEYLEKMDEDTDLPGFYGRLSANGYLDCTDWSGPFETESEAMADLILSYTE